MDGVSGLTQKPILPGQTFKYEFTFTRPGTFMYHPRSTARRFQAPSLSWRRVVIGFEFDSAT
jgi:FtsP/CotA-like multicopper oxidase with cupredoxin domain